MKNRDPSVHHPRFASTGQRLLSVLLLASFAGLIWLAWSGRFDSEVQQTAVWLREYYTALKAWFSANL